MKEKKSGNSVNSFSYPNDKEEILKELRVIAAREGKSQSELIMSIVEGYVKAHSTGNNTFKLDNWSENPQFKAVPTVLSDPQTWYKYLQECKPEERLDILKQVNLIRTNAISIGNFGKK